ncbi:hypothetical protein [Sphingomonas rhizophila]|uniref:hypothetical protein n=1 Tax=Sphingomonas rhizophila TaxID=2071607 RepID=UPI001FE9B95B|nr:hypothetical protein [Sphingomonas rhizophila]
MATHAPHKPQFYVDAVTPAQADSAYPLIRAVAPEVTLEGWKDYVQRRYRSGGLLGLWDNRGGIVGVLSYRLGERMRHGLVLALDDFVTFELSQAAPGRAALLEAAEKLGRDLGCTGLELRIGAKGLADPTAPRAKGWVALGLDLDSIVLVKQL